MKLRVKSRLLACIAIAAIAPAVNCAAQSNRAALDKDPDVIAVRQYKLTMDNVQKLVAATDAMNKMVAADPSLKKKMDAQGDNDKTIDQKIKNIDANFPQVAALLRAHGMSTRDYIMTSLAYLNDLMIVGMKKEGMIKDYPPNSVTPENAAFVEQNYQALKDIAKKLQPPDDSNQ